MQPPPELVKRLSHQGLIEAPARFETLYGGRSNQVWKVLGGANDTVLKLYNTTLENPLFRNDPTLEAACLRALKDTGFVPNLRATGSDARTHWVLYDHAPGTPWQTAVEPVAHLLRSLHEMTVQIDAPDGCDGSDALAAHGANILGNCQPAGRQALEQRMPTSQIAPNHDLCLIHGDPVAGNILADRSGLTLIDWQCPALGDPCEDLALFLSPAMQHIYRGAPLTQAEIRQFLVAYGKPDITERYLALRPWYAWRMAAYCLWRTENGAPDYAAGLDLELATL